MIRVGIKIGSTGRGAPKTLCKKRKDAELGLSSNSSKVTKAKGPFALIDKPHTRTAVHYRNPPDVDGNRNRWDGLPQVTSLYV